MSPIDFIDHVIDTLENRRPLVACASTPLADRETPNTSAIPQGALETECPVCRGTYGTHADGCTYE